MFYAGGSPPQTYTESWNGSAWTEVADLSTGVDSNSGAGSGNTSALSTKFDNTEEWDVPGVTKTLTVS
jgi:hypothetical protein